MTPLPVLLAEELPPLPHAELDPLINALVDPTNPCDACGDSIPGTLVPAGNDDHHLFVQSCDYCACAGTLDPAFSDDFWAAELVAAHTGWHVRLRYDDDTRRSWRPFVARPGGWDDRDFVCVDPDEYGWAPSAEIPLPPEGPARDGGRELVVVVPCGRRKRDRPVPAGAMYLGSYHHACRRYARRIGADRVLVLSARYGLLELQERIEPYDLRMGQSGCVDADTIRLQAQRLGVLDADVVVVGGTDYVERAAVVWPDAALPLRGCRGIGEQLRRLSNPTMEGVTGNAH